MIYLYPSGHYASLQIFLEFPSAVPGLLLSHAGYGLWSDLQFQGFCTISYPFPPACCGPRENFRTKLQKMSINIVYYQTILATYAYNLQFPLKLTLTHLFFSPKIRRPVFVAPYHLLAPKWAGSISSHDSLFHFEMKNSCQSGKPSCPTELSVMNPKLVFFIFRPSLSFVNIRTNSQPSQTFHLGVQTVLKKFNPFPSKGFPIDE